MLMSMGRKWVDPAPDVPTPALLRASRGAYSIGIRRELHRSGFDDVPRNGSYILGGMSNRGQSASNLVRQLGISKQATSELVETLVSRGYLKRRDVPEDRRRVDLSLTVRGQSAAAAIRRGVASVDDALRSSLTRDQHDGLRAGLIALCDIRERWEGQETTSDQ